MLSIQRDWRLNDSKVDNQGIPSEEMKAILVSELPHELGEAKADLVIVRFSHRSILPSLPSPVLSGISSLSGPRKDHSRPRKPSQARGKASCHRLTSKRGFDEQHEEPSFDFRPLCWREETCPSCPSQRWYASSFPTSNRWVTRNTARFHTGRL